MTYKEYRESVCKHCAAGNRQIDHMAYGLCHILEEGDSWAESIHTGCNAVGVETWANEQAASLKVCDDALDFLEKNSGCIKFGHDKHGKPCWMWRVGEGHYEPAFLLRTAIAAAMTVKEGVKDANIGPS